MKAKVTPLLFIELEAMNTNVILFGWNRSIPGREEESSKHFTEFNSYLTGLKDEGAIESYQVIFLDNHGGDLNGFFLIHGSGDQLGAVYRSDEWHDHITRASLHLDGVGAIGGATDDLVMKRMDRWNRHTGN